LILGDYEPTKSEKSFYDRKTETWETKSTTTDSGLSDENETEFFNLLEKYGGDCSDDEDGAFEDEDDEVIDDCGPLFNPVTGKIRASDDDLRQYAMTQPLCDLARAECPKGNKGRCKYGDCCGKMTTRDIWELRKKFWSFDTVKAATSSERNAKITSMLKLFYDPVTGNFNYFVSTTNLENGRRERTPVCERSFLTLLGYHSKSGQWTRCKTKVRGLMDDSTSELKMLRQSRSKTKFDTARAWLKRYCDAASDQLIHQSDLRKQGERIEALTEFVNIKSIPFESNKLFYEHYIRDVAGRGNGHVGRTCFDRALESFSSTSFQNQGYVVRMRRCKHNFSTCDICNNADALLRGGRSITEVQRRILQEYLHTHYKIQQAEREEQRLAIEAARETDHLGQPKQAFMLFDGFSVFKGVTPKWSRGVFGGKSHTEKEEPKVENRIIAGIIVCGDLDTVFAYSVDQLISGGANLMIEVIRQGLSDLGRLLKSKGKKVPRFLYLQFDNCGENKNKYMMAYCSMLVESGR
jgi:hypothetical protein